MHNAWVSSSCIGLTNDTDELLELQSLYRKLRSDAEEVVQDLLGARRLYLAFSTIMLVNGAVIMGLSIADLVLTWMGGVRLLEWPIPNLLLTVAVGIALIFFGGRMEDKAQRLKAKYGDLKELQERGQG